MSFPSDRISIFAGHQYINLETYRKNGQAVVTPVWFTVDNKNILVVTRTKTGKVKRLQNNTRVRIAPSGIRGQLKGDWIGGNAAFARPDQLERALVLRNKKYGLKARLSGLFSRTKGSLIGIIISFNDINGEV